MTTLFMLIVGVWCLIWVLLCRWRRPVVLFFFDSRPYTLPNLFLAIQMTCICFSHIPKISTHRAIKAVGNILSMGQSMQNQRVTLFSRQTLFFNNYPTTHWNKLVIFNVSTLLTITLVMLRLELEDAIGINSHR